MNPSQRDSKILLVNASSPSGGAAKAAVRIYSALKMRPRHQLGWISPYPYPEICDARPLEMSGRIGDRLLGQCARARERGRRRLLQPSVPDFGDRFDFGPRHSQRLVRRILGDADLVNLHWVSSLVSPETAAWIARERAPIIWTLHDMAPLTGGCHYDAGCGRFAGNCHDCPQIRSPLKFDYARRYQHMKQSIFDTVPDERVHLVAPTNWMASQARRSRLFRNRPIHVIPNAIDTAIYHARPKAGARKRLGLPESRPTILFIAHDVTSHRKGGHLVGPILDKIRARTPDVVFVSVGSGGAAPARQEHRIDFGRVLDENLLAEIYCAADLTLLPSFQDNLPNTMLESMACGVPVAGFDAGGSSDLIINGHTGAVVARGDISGLAEVVSQLLRHPERLSRFSRACIETVMEKCGPGSQSERYWDLYQRVLFASAGGRVDMTQRAS